MCYFQVCSVSHGDRETEKNTYFGYSEMDTVWNDTAYAKSYTIYALDPNTNDIIKGSPIIVGNFLEYDNVAFYVYDNYSKMIIFKNCDTYTTIECNAPVC